MTNFDFPKWKGGIVWYNPNGVWYKNAIQTFQFAQLFSIKCVKIISGRKIDAEQCNCSCIEVCEAWWRSQFEPEYAAANKLLKIQWCVWSF
jgi:hypothetical protein